MRLLDHRGHEIEVLEDNETSIRDLSITSTIQVYEVDKKERLKTCICCIFKLGKWVLNNPQNLMRWAFIYILTQVFFGNLQPSEILKSDDFKDMIKLYKSVKP